MIKDDVPKAEADKMVESGARILELRSSDEGVFCTVEVPDKPAKGEKEPAKVENSGGKKAKKAG